MNKTNITRNRPSWKGLAEQRSKEITDMQCQVDDTREELMELQEELNDTKATLLDVVTERDRFLAEHTYARTITLNYIPGRKHPSPDHPEGKRFDTGDYWTVGENGSYQNALDSRETLALVAAMLLGAEHPRLQTIYEHQYAAIPSRERVLKKLEELDASILESDTRAMMQIQAILNGQEWNADTASAIAEVVTSTGRQVDDLDDTQEEGE